MADSKKYNGSTWEHSLRKLTTATEVVENPLYSDGTAITSYTIKGNTIQNGTPTPENPVDVNGVGVRTAQLFDKSTWNGVSAQRGTIEVVTNGFKLTATSNDAYTNTYGSADPQYSYRVVEGETYTLSWEVDNADTSGVVFIFTGTTAGGTVLTNINARQKKVSFTIPSGHNYVAFRLGVSISGKSITYTNIMLNSGSTAKPYEPYGYKIPISSGGVTTNIYLGSTQTVRAIKKLVLTGEEYWDTGTVGANRFFYTYRPDAASVYMPIQSSHYIPSNVPGAQRPNNSIRQTASANAAVINIRDDACATLSDFKQYLAGQYANGTPVTVWYILANPDTAAVNEPLMKIGNYADTLSNATAIPTTEGANSITVDTTVQPSEFTATWTGWHNSSVKEWDGSQWN